MSKIENRAGLSLDVNIRFHVGFAAGTDIVIDADNNTISSTTTDFTGTASSITGVANGGLAVGDQTVIGNSAGGNDGVVIELTAVAANALSYTVVDGVPVNEAAGSNINLVRRKKYYQFLEANGLSFVDGVAMSAFHSKLQDLWDGGDLDVFDPPTTSIEPRAKSMAIINYWEHFDLDTLNSIRDGAMEVRNTKNSAPRLIYGLLRSGNLHESTDQMFYFKDLTNTDAPVAAVMTGFINQLVLLVDTDNTVDNRGVFYVRCAEPRKTIIMEAVDMQYAEIYPVGSANAIDSKLGDAAGAFTADGVISAGGSDYENIIWGVDVDESVLGNIEGTDYTFTGTLDHDNKQNNLVHEKINYLLRQPTNINSDGTGSALRGDKQWPITAFVGDVLNVNDGFSVNYLASDQNNIRNLDSSEVERKYSTIAAFSFVFTDSRLVGVGKISVYDRFTHGNDGAIPVQDASNTDLEDITISALVMPFTFSYSTYAVGDHAADTPLPIRASVAASGLVEAENFDYTIISSTSQEYRVPTTPDPSYVD